MTVAEIIQMIKGLSPSEQEEVSAFLAARPSNLPEVNYISDEKAQEAVEEVFTEYAELFKQLRIAEMEENRKNASGSSPS